MLTKLYRRTRQIWQILSLRSHYKYSDDYQGMTYNELSVYGRLRKIEYVITKSLQDSIMADVKKVNSGSTACGKSCLTFGETRFPRNKYMKKCDSFRGTMRYVQETNLFTIWVCFESQPDFVLSMENVPSWRQSREQAWAQTLPKLV